MVVAVGGQDLDDAVSEVEQGDVERAAAQVEDEDLLLGALLVQAVGKGSGRGLVHDALDVEARDLAGVLGGLTLGIIEVGRDGDDGVRDLLGVGLHLCERHGAHLLSGVILALDVDDGTATLALLDLIRHGLDLGGALGVLAAHEALDGEHGVLGVGHGLVLGGLAHDAVTLGTEAHDGRGGAVALGVHDDRGLTPLEHRHRGVGGTKVDTQNLAHGAVLSFCVRPPWGAARAFNLFVRLGLCPLRTHSIHYLSLFT